MTVLFQKHIEQILTADIIRFVNDWTGREITFVIDNTEWKVTSTQLQSIFHFDTYTEACDAFIDKLANPAEFARSNIGMRLTLPKELKLRVAMDVVS